MALNTQPLRDVHRELLPHVAHVRQLGDMAGRAPAAELRARLDAVVEFLRRQVVPHAQAEEAVLYPAVDRLIGDGATATMARDHAEVAHMALELAALRDAAPDRALDDAELVALRRLAYGLSAVLTLHFAKEDEIYLPLLERALSAEEGRSLFAAMERARARAPATDSGGGDGPPA